MKKSWSGLAIIHCILFCSFFATSVQSQQIIPQEYNHLVDWQFKTANAVYASPTLKADTVFIGGLDKRFYALDANTGSKFWEYSVPNEIRSTAAITQDLVLFESGNILYALNSNGTLEWKADLFKDSLQNQIDAWDFFHSSPVIHEGVVYIGTENGLVLGFRISDGKEVFRCQTKNRDIIRSTPAIANDTIFFGDWEGVLYAYSLNSSEELWQYDTKEDVVYGWKNSIQAAPVVIGNSVYFAGRSSRLYSLNAETGMRNWVYASPTDQWLMGGISINDGLVYVGSSDQRLFQAFQASSGVLQWKAEVDCRTWGAPAINDHTLYVLSNSLYAIHTQSGEIKSQVKFDTFHQDIQMGEYVDRSANVHSSPVLHDGKLIFGSDDGYVYAIDVSKM